jgi:hypothetical protein
MNIHIDFKYIFNCLLDFISNNKKYFITLLCLIILYLSTYQYIRASFKTTPTVRKQYSKLNLESDINILDCKLNQRVCYYDNITNSLESAINNCKDIDYCDSLK